MSFVDLIFVGITQPFLLETLPISVQVIVSVLYSLVILSVLVGLRIRRNHLDKKYPELRMKRLEKVFFKSAAEKAAFQKKINDKCDKLYAEFKAKETEISQSSDECTNKYTKVSLVFERPKNV